MRKILICCFAFACFMSAASGQVTYPYPVNKISLIAEGQQVKMAYMDIEPENPSAKSIVLLHGKNFNGYYWKELIPFLQKKGYRVIVPDQVGWGQSDHPDLHYSFHLLSDLTKQLLDTLGIAKTVVMGHSMGGMLAIRFALMFPGTTEKLILENPIGLEDYKTFVPYQPLQKLLDKEKQATYQSYKKYQQSYYPEWRPTYEQYVQVQAADLKSPDFNAIARVNALTFQMIYEQPICYEFSRINVPTLLVIGLADRTVVGKDLLDDAQKLKHGQYPVLGKAAARLIRKAVLKELPGVGHIPHVQVPAQFQLLLQGFL